MCIAKLEPATGLRSESSFYLASMCIHCIYMYVYTLHLHVHVCVCIQCFFCAMSVDDQLDEDDLELIKENIGVDIQVVSRL